MENIVIVEDEAITAMDIERKLSRMGYHVSGISATGEEAIELADKMRPDLILMDIMLSGEMDGIVAAREITNKFHIPIVFLTAYQDQSTYSRAKQSDPYGYITKPFETRELEIAVDLAIFKSKSYDQLTRAESRYHTLMNNASCGIIIHDRMGVIQEVNHVAEIILQQKYADIVGTNLISYIHDQDVEYFQLKINKLLCEKGSSLNVDRIVQKNSNILDVDMVSAYLDLGEDSLICTIINNISEKNKLISNQMLNDKLSTIGTLTTGIIHEINNPLSWIALNLSEMNKIVDEIKIKYPLNGFEKQLQQLLHESTDGANKIQRIIRELKGFGRHSDDELISCNIHNIIDTAINIATPQFKHIAKLEKFYSQDIPDVMLNSSKMQQVFVNLLVNAAQSFTGKQQQDENLIRLTTHLEPDAISIVISDNGCGMPDHVLSQIFEPFYTTKPAGVGTGLGMPICKKIIHDMRGDIAVKSTEGIGTEVVITFPIKIKLTASVSKLDTDNEVVKIIGKSILIVDDDKTSLVILKRILGKSNEVVSAHSGREALQLLSGQNNFDCIITDLNMYDIDGVDLFKYLENQNHPLKDRMIFVTGGAYTEKMKHFMTTNSPIFLEKPYTPQQLFEMLLKKMK